MEQRIRSRQWKIILTDLMNGKVFRRTPGRCGYPSFKNMKESVIDIDFRDFFNPLTPKGSPFPSLKNHILLVYREMY